MASSRDNLDDNCARSIAKHSNTKERNRSSRSRVVVDDGLRLGRPECEVEPKSDEEYTTSDRCG